MKQPSQLTPNIHEESLKTFSSVPFTIHSRVWAKGSLEVRGSHQALLLKALGGSRGISTQLKKLEEVSSILR